MDTVKINSKETKIIAHRGLSGIERENTYPAFVAAGNRSYYGIETDIHTTADGKFVVIHDETTERVSLGVSNINVEQVNWDELKDIVLPDLDSSTHRRDIKLPLLTDYIKICKKYNKVCVLEIKNAFSRENLQRVVAEIKSLEYIENVIFISFVFENCVILRDLVPQNDIQWLTSEPVNKDVIKKLKDNNLNLDIYYRQLNKEIIDELHSNGIKVNCWTCDSKEDAEKLVEMGVDFITSNIIE